MKLRSIALIYLMMCCVASPAFAADDGITEPIGFAKRARITNDSAFRIVQGQTELSAGMFLTAVDNNYPRLDAADSRRRIASARRLEVQGAFDPVLSTLDGYTWMQNTSRFATRKRVIFNQPML